jgi:hypothetical protein
MPFGEMNGVMLVDVPPNDMSLMIGRPAACTVNELIGTGDTNPTNVFAVAKF